MRHSNHHHDSNWHDHDHQHSHSGHHHRHHHWDEPMYSYEGELTAEKGYALLNNVSSTLQQNGEIKLNDHSIKPIDPKYFAIHHEETDEGYHKLTLEVQWWPEEEGADEEQASEDEIPVVA